MLIMLAILNIFVIGIAFKVIGGAWDKIGISYLLDNDKACDKAFDDLWFAWKVFGVVILFSGIFWVTIYIIINMI